jgi:hypothetical protein
MAGLALVLGAGAPPPPESYRIQDFKISGVHLVEASRQGGPVLEMTMPRSAYQDPTKERLTDRSYMAWLPIDFRDGTIELDISGEQAPDAPDYARGFVGVSFRIDEQGRFENIYLRPTNSIADDQVRRNHTVQYFAYPEYPFDRLRREAPERYETYADIAPGRWIRFKLVVAGQTARLYLDGAAKPAFVVTDLKLGARQSGGVGVWIESGTLARFRNLRVTPAR